MAYVLIMALVIGFVAGIVGALITIEIKTDTIRKEIDDAILGISHVNTQLKTLKDSDNALTLAVQKLIVQVKRDRGQIWESLNGLWNDYDERHKADQKPKAATAEKPKPKRTKKEGEQK